MTRRRGRPFARWLATAGVVVAVAAVPACASSNLRFDPNTVDGVTEQCPELQRAYADLLIGIDSATAATKLTAATTDPRLQASIATLRDAGSDPAALTQQESLDASNDVRTWLSLVCPKK